MHASLCGAGRRLFPTKLMYKLSFSSRANAQGATAEKRHVAYNAVVTHKRYSPCLEAFSILASSFACSSNKCSSFLFFNISFIHLSYSFHST